MVSDLSLSLSDDELTLPLSAMVSDLAAYPCLMMN